MSKGLKHDPDNDGARSNSGPSVPPRLPLHTNYTLPDLHSPLAQLSPNNATFAMSPSTSGYANSPQLNTAQHPQHSMLHSQLPRDTTQSPFFTPMSVTSAQMGASSELHTSTSSALSPIAEFTSASPSIGGSIGSISPKAPRPRHPGMPQRSRSDTDALHPVAHQKTKAARKVNRLSDRDRLAICRYQMEHPELTQENLASRFGVDRTTVCKILKQRGVWLRTTEAKPRTSDPITSHANPSSSEWYFRGYEWRPQHSQFPSQSALPKISPGANVRSHDSLSRSMDLLDAEFVEAPAAIDPRRMPGRTKDLRPHNPHSEPSMVNSSATFVSNMLFNPSSMDSSRAPSDSSSILDPRPVSTSSVAIAPLSRGQTEPLASSFPVTRRDSAHHGDAAQYDPSSPAHFMHIQHVHRATAVHAIDNLLAFFSSTGSSLATTSDVALLANLRHRVLTAQSIGFLPQNESDAISGLLNKVDEPFATSE